MKNLRIFFFLAIAQAHIGRAEIIDDEYDSQRPAIPLPSISDSQSNSLTESDGNGGHKNTSSVEPKSTVVPHDPKKEKKTTPAAKVDSGSKKASLPRGSKKSREPVHFESKGLRGLKEKGLVELMDDVVVTQGAFRLEADRAKVFFDEAAHEVSKVVAEGNVKVFNVDEKTGEKLKAYGNQIVFFNRDRKVIMEGNARVWRGEDSVIRGKKITYELETGWVRADRVAGELTPSEKDSK